MSKQVFIASDHAGFSLKQHLLRHLNEINWADLGPTTDERVDYPDYADHLALRLREPQQVGILVCGSGQGMAMRANKYPLIRAALCWNEEVAKLAREHNDANVLCLGARVLDFALCERIVKTFLQTSFEGGRHQDRVIKISKPV